MTLRPFLFASAAFSTLAASLSAPALAEEGMWTFDAFPAAQVRQRYGWAPDQAWLDKVRQSAVRLTGGCSASFVSAEGLILTNHHCVAGCLQDVSTAKLDYVDNGFTAATRANEKLCPGQQAEVVTAIRDVTGDVNGTIGNATGLAAVKAKTAAIARIESAGCPDTKLTRCQVVTLYGGGQYKLYTYHKYSDVRIVWAPEAKAPQFGGDPDNFNFPRYALDAAFLRAYENGQPVATPQHLAWSPRPPVEGEAVEGAEGEGKKKKLSGKALILFIVLPAVLVLGGGGAAAYLLLFSGHPAEQHAEAGEHGKAKGEAPAEPTPGPNGTTIVPGEAGVTFVGLPEMLVNIGGPDGRPAFLKLKLTIEAPNQEAVTSAANTAPSRARRSQSRAASS